MCNRFLLVRDHQLSTRNNQTHYLLKWAERDK
jgi:hypothetical protein